VLKVLESKAERVALELKADPTRSDREIGRICGVSHHTVGRRRTELGLVDRV
jgi:DNA-binding CsgD family transcriptional regulator